MNVVSAETRMMGLPYGEEIMIVGQTMWTQCTGVTDGQTDRQTDRITITKTVQCIASRVKTGEEVTVEADEFCSIAQLRQFVSSLFFTRHCCLIRSFVLS